MKVNQNISSSSQVHKCLNVQVQVDYYCLNLNQSTSSQSSTKSGANALSSSANALSSMTFNVN